MNLQRTRAHKKVTNKVWVIYPCNHVTRKCDLLIITIKQCFIQRKYSFKNTLMFSAVVCLFLISHAIVLSQSNASDVRRLTGVVVQDTDTTAIPGVHVINISRQRGSVSGSDGSFAIDVCPGDSILFQALGFTNGTLFISEAVFFSDEQILFSLESQTYELSGVTVSPLPPYAEFRRSIINFKDTMPDFRSNLSGINLIPASGHPPLPSLLSPVSYFYARFSKRGKEIIKYREVVDKEKAVIRSGWVFDHDLVRRITGLEDEEEILSFLSYCKVTGDFVQNTPETEVYEAILACYKSYIENMDDPDKF